MGTVEAPERTALERAEDLAEVRVAQLTGDLDLARRDAGMAKLTLEELQRRERRQTQLLEAGKDALVDPLQSRVELAQARETVDRAESAIPRIEGELVQANRALHQAREARRADRRADWERKTDAIAAELWDHADHMLKLSHQWNEATAKAERWGSPPRNPDFFRGFGSDLELRLSTGCSRPIPPASRESRRPGDARVVTVPGPVA